MKILRLNLKKVWWDQIKSGEKTEEYRLVTGYWKKRLIDKTYDEVHFLLGYPARGVDSKVLKFEYTGFERKQISHPEFGADPVDVFCIQFKKLNNNGSMGWSKHLDDAWFRDVDQAYAGKDHSKNNKSYICILPPNDDEYTGFKTLEAAMKFADEQLNNLDSYGCNYE